MDDRALKIRHSSHNHSSGKSSKNSSMYSKSDLNVALSTSHNKSLRNEVEGEYYKRYEHDEVPVKDSCTTKSSNLQHKNKGSLTNSYLDKLEKRIFQTVSQELQTDEDPMTTLEFNIRLFKTTVENIFDNFYTSMRDFDHYKERFHQILAKSKEGSVDDMEDFIKDMFENIVSSENSSSKLSANTCHLTDEVTNEISVKETVCSSGDGYTDLSTSSSAILEAYKNDNYFTDSNPDENLAKLKTSKADTFNIFVLGEHPLQIKMNDRNLLSEVNIRASNELTKTCYTASADNFKKLAAKKLEVETYEKQQNHNIPDIDIPVKVSNPKKNIFLNEDFTRSDRSDTMSLISKICNILCKKFRKG